MSDINKHPVLRKLYEVALSLERLPSSPEQTTTAILLSDAARREGWGMSRSRNSRKGTKRRSHLCSCWLCSPRERVRKYKAMRQAPPAERGGEKG